MKKFMAMLLALVMTLSLAACGKKADDTAKDDANVDDTTAPEISYAVEAGSAGEEVALANGFKTVSVNSQADALMEVSSGTSDAAIIDLLMAGAMVGEGTSYPDLKANQNFLELQAQLEGTENRISVARKEFNEVAKTYNVAVRRFPANLVAKLFGFGQKPYFEAAEGTETAPRVQF